MLQIPVNTSSLGEITSKLVDSIFSTKKFTKIQSTMWSN